MKKVDLNVDIGEGFPHDEALLEFATSANVCCGKHAGNWKLTTATVEMCESKGVRYGMHPGYPSRGDMGRGSWSSTNGKSYWRSISSSTTNFREIFAPAYVKPHGGFYNDTATSMFKWKDDLAQMQQYVDEIEPGKWIVNEEIRNIQGCLLIEILQPTPVLMGLPNTTHEVIARKAGADFIREGFADRAYRPDGTLVPRSEPGAVLDDPEEIKAQVLRLADQVDSICLHGDTPNCLEFAEMVYKTLVDHGYEVGY